MPTTSPIRDILYEVGRAICSELVRLMNERGRYPLRTNSALARQLLSGEAVQVTQARDSRGRFGNAALTIVAQDYLQWIDTGRRPGAKKVPLSALLLFVKQRGLGQVRGKGGKFGQRTASANSIAWAIQTAIYKNGIKGRHMIAPAFEAGQLLLDKLLDTDVLDSLTRDLDQSFTYLSKA